MTIICLPQLFCWSTFISIQKPPILTHRWLSFVTKGHWWLVVGSWSKVIVHQKRQFYRPMTKELSFAYNTFSSLKLSAHSDVCHICLFVCIDVRNCHITKFPMCNIAIDSHIMNHCSLVLHNFQLLQLVLWKMFLIFSAPQLYWHWSLCRDVR